MKLEEVLNELDYYEPESIRILFPELSDSEVEQVLILQALTYNVRAWNDCFIFENVVLGLNEIKPEFGVLQGTLPEQIWYAVKLLHTAFPSREYGYEVKQYIKFMSNQNGVYIYPPSVFSKDENPYYEKAEFLARSRKTLSESLEEIQASKLLGIDLYIRFKEEDSRFKKASAEKTEAYYTKEVPQLETDSGAGKDTLRWIWSDDYSVYFADNDSNYGMSLTNQDKSILYSSPTTTTDPRTISLWFKFELAGNGLTRTLLTWGWNSAIMCTNTSNAISFKIKSGSIISFASSLTVDNWNHIAVTYPVQSSGLLYLNGVAKGYTDIGIYASPSNIWFGTGSGGSSTTKIKGNINDLAVWDKVLSATEIAQLYASKKLDYRQNYQDYHSAGNLKEYYLMGDDKDSVPATDKTYKIFNQLNRNIYFTNTVGIIYKKETQS